MAPFGLLGLLLCLPPAVVVDGISIGEFYHPGLKQKAILIRHGEKDSGDDLSPRGYQRADCLVNHFADYGITHLFAFDDKHTRRPVETITPLSKALGLPIDTSIGRDDVKGLRKAIENLPSNAIVLVCWEHKVLTEVAEELGVADAPKYGSDEFDLQWTVVEGDLTAARENC
eukprot:CAMPEP_0114512528 /NCGR_PEP_ID=MMETSP0109-20121206/15030_1 /TAXON_ID=29199 /ORGANISM="Chlorarachnion reptans, Strain CCCM449" /LENGTH=171 /DNA_ID=CAMNT_0001692231 /DNA_START=36 /DNA_END=551 /DNA_ORIENTATION=+